MRESDIRSRVVPSRVKDSVSVANGFGYWMRSLRLSGRKHSAVSGGRWPMALNCNRYSQTAQANEMRQRFQFKRRMASCQREEASERKRGRARKEKTRRVPCSPRTRVIRIGGPFGRIGARRFADCPFFLATRFDCEWHSHVPESIRGLRGCLARIRTWTEISLLGKA